MIVVQPITVTPAMLTTNVAEDDYPAYSAGTTYALGDRVIVAADHLVYESLAAGNIGNTPSSSPTKWAAAYATKPWRMFDQSIGTKTTRTTNITVTVAPGAVVTDVVLLELAASSVRVKMTDPTYGVVFDKTQNLISSEGITSWWAWFFSPIKRATRAIFSGLPAFKAASIEITITTDTGSTAECGVCLLGTSTETGATLAGVSFGVQSHSRKEQDAWGNYSITRRGFSKKLRCKVLVERNQADTAGRLFASLIDTPALFIASDAYDMTVIYGFVKDFDVNIAYFNYSECSLDIEGMQQ